MSEMTKGKTVWTCVSPKGTNLDDRLLKGEDRKRHGSPKRYRQRPTMPWSGQLFDNTAPGGMYSIGWWTLGNPSDKGGVTVDPSDVFDTQQQAMNDYRRRSRRYAMRLMEKATRIMRQSHGDG